VSQSLGWDRDIDNILRRVNTYIPILMTLRTSREWRKLQAGRAVFFFYMKSVWRPCMTSYLCGYLGRKVGRHGMSSSSHEGFITSLSHIVCNNRRSRKYGYLVARQLSRSDNVRLYADPRVYGPSCTLQFLHLILSLFAISRGNAADTRARVECACGKNFCNVTFTSRDWTRDIP